MKTGQGNGQNMSEYGKNLYQRFLNAKTHSYHRKFWLQRKVELKKKICPLSTKAKRCSAIPHSPFLKLYIL